MEKEKIGELLKSFIFFDIVFTVSFCLGGLIEYERDIFMLSFIIVTLVTYYPLYIYVKDYLSMTILKEKTWYFKHMNTCLFFCIYRIFLIFAYLSIAIIDSSGIDVAHNIAHLPIFSKVVLIAMIATAFMLVLLAIRIVPFHYNYAFNTITTSNVNVSITKTTNPSHFENLRYRSVGALNLHASKSVFLVPNSKSEDHCLLITDYANKEFEVDTDTEDRMDRQTNHFF
jgi:hypothetical protein